MFELWNERLFLGEYYCFANKSSSYGMIELGAYCFTFKCSSCGMMKLGAYCFTHNCSSYGMIE